MSQIKSNPISLSRFEREDLERIIRKHTSPFIQVIRAKIILLADEGLSQRQIADNLSISRAMVQHWYQRWLETDYLADVKARLADAPRPGAPATYTASPLCALIAMACECPSVRARPISHWTQQEIADEAIKRNIVDNISQRSVGRFLNEADLQPHRVRGWLTPKQDEQFDEKCQDICETYQKALEREKKGEKTISIDEMTFISAL